jgi:hypothetical protein
MTVSVIAEAARIQTLLEGVPLPAKTKELVSYAAAQPGGASAATALRRLPKREFQSLDDVGEALAPVQPASRAKEKRPRRVSRRRGRDGHRQETRRLRCRSSTSARSWS